MIKDRKLFVVLGSIAIVLVLFAGWFEMASVRERAATAELALGPFTNAKTPPSGYSGTADRIGPDLPLDVDPSPGSGMVDVDGLEPSLILDQRFIEGDHDEVERISLVKGGGSFPYHRIRETLRYDPYRQRYLPIRQSMVVADHILVKLKADQGEEALDELNRRFGTHTVRSMGFANKYMVGLPDVTLDGISEYSRLFAEETGMVEQVQPDTIVGLSAIPNDPNWLPQWDKRRVDAPEVWDYNTGSTNIIVAVIDSGVDLDHSDLASQIWHNPGEAGALSTNGVDDDANGYIDDWIGWDFGQDDNDPDDNGDGVLYVNGHGTRCAGILGAVGNNSNYIAGFCWNITIMALKPFEYFSEYHEMRAYCSKLEAAMVYAADNGARVTSNSYGSWDCEDSSYDGVAYQNERGVLFVASAGNGTDDTDFAPNWPASIDLPNVISVGSSTTPEGRSSFSNYGAESVDLFAPGSKIPCTLPDDKYTIAAGTSMACPQVAGAVALLYSINPYLSSSACRQAILEGVDVFPDYEGYCVSGGRLNIFSSLKLLFPNDDDFDGLPNDWESWYFGDATNGIPDALCSNGVNTMLEAYVADFPPTNPDAGFFITELHGDYEGTGAAALEWDQIPDRFYTLYWTSNLLEGAFAPIQSVSNYTGGILFDYEHMDEPAGFYSISVELAP